MTQFQLNQRSKKSEAGDRYSDVRVRVLNPTLKKSLVHIMFNTLLRD